MRILGPSDLLTAAVTVRDGVTDAADLWPRALGLVDRVEAMVSRGEALLAQAEELLAQAALSRAHVDAVADAADATNARVAGIVARAEALVAAGEQLMPTITPMADKALPIAAEVVDSIDRDEVLAVVGLIDRLPGTLRQLDQLAPDVREILDAVTDLSHAAQGLPGMGSLIRRGERKDDEGEV
ncbi:hypothetical protein [Arsenicicoccus dermatophilus]|uniref:hypothetical protein n=1 Tax=Arsenicicoccus dermatophilus TaxID=1076331 RepID=UPI001F4CF4E7|nr:hypothetical protein [Arsenicicoccus dermatophilus]MCH8612472.1 hypothetical protein [Arsenicicoccus dermatophilus]